MEMLIVHYTPFPYITWKGRGWGLFYEFFHLTRIWSPMMA